MSHPVLIDDTYHKVLKMMASMPTEERTMGDIVEDQLKQLNFFKKQLKVVEKTRFRK
jgi:hypothetical protein